MTPERPTPPFDLLKIHLRDIEEDFGKVNQLRWEALSVRERALKSLKIVTDAHFVLASDEEYRTGDIAASSHVNLMSEWKENARKSGLHLPSIFVSGIDFRLKIDDSKKYVRLDVLTHNWKELPEYAKTLIEAGYTVVDAQYKRVDKDVDYSVWWTERNDL